MIGFDKNLQKEILRLEKELLALKQTRRLPSMLYSYSYSVGTITPSRYLVTYASGSQPIISEFVSYATITPGQISGNTQYIWAFSQSSASLTILSTRQVLSCVRLAE